MKILLPVDGSELSLEAVRFAIRMLLAGLHGEVVLANVQEPASLYELIVAHDPEVLEQVTAQAGLHTLKSAQELLDAAEISYECEVAQGDPAHTLIDISERFACDLIVMGAARAWFAWAGWPPAWPAACWPKVHASSRVATGPRSASCC